MGGEDLVFRLTVGDGEFTDVDTVTFHVRNINDPPSCDLAMASRDTLSPPNHNMLLVEIDNVMDDASDPFNTFTLAITSVTQDEPVAGLGGGDTSPDAVIDSGSKEEVLLRAERDDSGNGRVYKIDFTADDGFESCDGRVVVTVPLTRKGDPAVDDGQLYDSTLP